MVKERDYFLLILKNESGSKE